MCAAVGNIVLRYLRRAYMHKFLLAVVAVVTLAAAPMLALANTGREAFGFNGTASGFPAGAGTLTGGGAYDPATGFVQSAGGFRCTADVRQGPLAGCLAGQGVRWDTVRLLPSTTFKCTGAAAEALKA